MGEARTSFSEAISNVINWLREGDPNAKNHVDLPWEVVEKEAEGTKYYMATYKDIPYIIYIYPLEELKIIRLVIDPLISTKFMDNDKRLRLYYGLLKISTNPSLVKAGLVGDDDGIVFIADLSAYSLGKEELNQALEELLITAYGVVYELGQEMAALDAYLKGVLAIVEAKKEKGASADEVRKFLTEKLGLKGELADALIKEVYGEGAAGKGPFTGTI